MELLNEFEAQDIIVVDHSENHSTFSRLETEDLRTWLEDDYTLGELWKKNVLGGDPRMREVMTYCKGPTEEAFINKVLKPSFSSLEIYLKASPCCGVSK